MQRIRTKPARPALWLLLLALLVVVPVAAADSTVEGEIRLQPAREGSVWVGQELELQLELWSDGFTFGDQLFVLPEVAGGYLLQADSSTVKLNENREGVAWQGLRYSLLFYPQREGRLEVPAFEVRFTSSAGFGTEPSRFEFLTPALAVDSKMPPGAKRGSLLITSNSFELDYSWSPPLPVEGPLELRVGDALTLEVTRKAQGVPGMVFAPLPDFSIDGLAVYPGSPAVRDRINRGDLSGSRTDSVTFICEREGSFSVPELRFQWWDPQREKLSERLITAAELTVAANPAFQSGAAAVSQGGESGPGWAMIAASVALVLLAAYLLRRIAQRAASAVRYWLQQRRAGEDWAFEQAQKACRSNAPHNAYRAISIWLDRAEPEAGLSLMAYATAREDQELLREAIALQENLAADGDAGWNGSALARLLEKARNNASKIAPGAPGLPPLNPRFKRL
jgi:hypothetical protein